MTKKHKIVYWISLHIKTNSTADHLYGVDPLPPAVPGDGVAAAVELPGAGGGAGGAGAALQLGQPHRLQLAGEEARQTGLSHQRLPHTAAVQPALPPHLSNNLLHTCTVYSLA